MRHICKTGLLLCFYPRHPRGWRQTSFGLAAPTPLFLSTPPSRVATWRYNLFADRDSGFYPRHPRGWRRVGAGVYHQAGFVSIHATLAGGDDKWRAKLYSLVTFLSTPPSRVATGPGRKDSARDRGFYPRHPRGWRRAVDVLICGGVEVSIHATLAGGDTLPAACESWTCGFLSTPPSRVATRVPHIYPGIVQFLSTPPSRVATWAACAPSNIGSGFYPRHPRGRRLYRCPAPAAALGFLSTPPSRVATAVWIYLSGGTTCFYPRHPRGWRLPFYMSG